MAKKQLMYGLKGYFKSVITDERNDFLSAALKLFLSLAASVYRLMISAILLAYDLRILKADKLPRPVISVGNITWGGTGKTGCVEMLARRLRGENRKVAVLLRGYGRHRMNRDISTLGDEGYLLSCNLVDIPVLAGRNRITSGRQAINRYAADTLILDDGFQQWALKRDLDIVLLDAANPFGNYRLIPRGILREPLCSLRRADVFIISNADPADAQRLGAIKQKLAGLNSKALIAEAVYRPLNFSRLPTHQEIPLDYVSKKNVCTFCAIGNPASFERTVKKLGAALGLAFRFLDHYFYRPHDLSKIAAACRNKKIHLAVTTPKDAVKLSALKVKTPLEILVLHSKFSLTDTQDEFFYRLSALYRRPGA